MIAVDGKSRNQAKNHARFHDETKIESYVKYRNIHALIHNYNYFPFAKPSILGK